ncbi:MAG TPA: sulfatase-like hydrolase/transferase [Thermoanaerobaculia bacterium]|nr:sulfatase-like hydrolase/transferase [Thermoanaerobaculia bacterium]
MSRARRAAYGQRPAAIGLGILLAAGAVAWSACGRRGGGEPSVPPGTPVVLISIDTLRADHLPAYGYSGVATPAIDALRRDAILYERAYTHTPLTLPSHTALLTGLLPVETGVRDNVGYVLDPERVKRHEVPFLPSILHEHGYATGGAVSAFVLLGKTGLGTGFDFYEDSIEFRSGTGLGGLRRPGSETLRLSLDWLRGAAARPFFFFFHIYEPHAPYQPPEPFASRYRLKYDGEIATADWIVGQLLAELKRLGAYDRALVVLLSDHGEGLGDHGEDEHGVLLYNEAIHVPLLLKLPGAQLAGRSAAAPAQLTDVTPTVLGLLGLPVPPRLRGARLLGLLDPAPMIGGGGRRVYSETFYPRLHFGWSDLASLVDRRYHYIDGPGPELYDLARDPGEKTNLLARERRVYADMRRELGRYDRNLAPPSPVDEQTRQAMAALGYLAGAAVHTAAGPLPDPKSQLGSLTDVKRGFAAMAQHDYRLAAATFTQVLAKNPRMADAWEFLGHARQKLGDSEAALDAYAHALRAAGGSPTVAMAAAALYFDLGRLAPAETHARMALATSPSFAHGLLAQIALARKDLPGAEREARLAMEGSGLRIGPMIILAEVLHARGRYEEALAETRRAEQAYAGRASQDPALIQGLALVRGRVQADLGDAVAAEASFKEEIARYPEDIRAYPNLAILYALTNRPAAARAALEQMVAAHPSPAAYAAAVKALRALADPAGATAVLRYAQHRFPHSPELRALAAE